MSRIGKTLVRFLQDQREAFGRLFGYDKDDGWRDRFFGSLRLRDEMQAEIDRLRETVSNRTGEVYRLTAQLAARERERQEEADWLASAQMRVRSLRPETAVYTPGIATIQPGNVVYRATDRVWDAPDFLRAASEIPCRPPRPRTSSNTFTGTEPEDL